MTFQPALAAAGSLLLLVAVLHGILFTFRGGKPDRDYLAWLVTLGLVGGAAITPFLRLIGG